MANAKRLAGFRSGALARETGVSVDTLRHYERRGLLPAPMRLANGYRIYGTDSLARVQLIQRGLSLGFSLAELADFLQDRDAGRPPCGRVRRVAGERLKEVERRLVQLKAFRDELRRVIRNWDQRLAAGPADRPMRLLDTASDTKREGADALAGIRFARRPSRNREE